MTPIKNRSLAQCWNRNRRQTNNPELKPTTNRQHTDHEPTQILISKYAKLNRHLFRKWLGADQTTCHYHNKCRVRFLTHALTENWLDESKQDLYGLQGYINFVKEKEEVASPYILKMGLVSPLGLTWNILTVRWSHYLLKLKEVVLICLPMSSLLSFIECQIHHWIYSMIVLQISWIP